jgi:hypothetical protein
VGVGYETTVVRVTEVWFNTWSNEAIAVVDVVTLSGVEEAKNELCVVGCLCGVESSSYINTF